MTGQRAFLITCTVFVPIKISLAPVAPCVPIITISAFSFMVVSTISSTKVLKAEELQEMVTTLNLAAATLEQEIKNRYPDYANLINPDNIDVAKARNAFDENEALISIYTGRKQG